MHDQSEDSNPTKPTHRRNEKKEKTVEDKRERAAQVTKEALTLLLKPCSPTTIEHAFNKIVNRHS